MKDTAACIKAKIGVEEGAGFQRSQSDRSMFIRRSKPEAPFFWFMWMTLLSLVMNDLASINELKKTLRTQRNLENSKSFLEIEVMRSQRGLEPNASMQ